MNFLRRPYFTSDVKEQQSLTRDAPNKGNGLGCLAKTPPTKDPRDTAPPPQTDSLPKDYWFRSTRSSQKMDTRSPFRGGGGMQVHAVPDGERATVNGQQLPWAYEYAE